jgi:hypothetical protein
LIRNLSSDIISVDNNAQANAGRAVMEMKSLSGPNLGNYSRAIDEVNNNPEVKQLQAQVDSYQKKVDRCDTMLKLPRDERLKQSGELGDEHWKTAARMSVHTFAPLAMVGWMGGGLAGIMAANAAGIISPQLQGLLALGVLITTFKGMPQLMVKGLRKWDIPKRADKGLKKHYEQEQATYDRLLKVGKDSLERAKLEALNRLVEKEKQNKAAPQTVKEIEEEPDYIVLDGIKLSKKKEEGQALMKYSLKNLPIEGSRRPKKS